MKKSDHNCWGELFAGDLAQTTEIFKLLPITVNGARRYAAPEKSPAVLIASRKIRLNDSVQTCTVLLLPGSTPEPEPGDLIAWDGRKREIIKVKLCRSLSGEVAAIECTTA